MTTQERDKLEMAARVREFVLARLADEPSCGPVLAGWILGRARVIAGKQHAGRIAAKAARAKRSEIRRVLHFQLLRSLTAVGEVAARDRVELVDRFKLPSGKVNNTKFLIMVKALIEAAEEPKELLVEAGMNRTLLEDLKRMVAEFEAVIESVNTAQRDRIGAGAELEVIVGEVSAQVKVLDGITRYRYGMDRKVMAEWRAVKRMPAHPRPGPAQPDAGEAPAA